MEQLFAQQANTLLERMKVRVYSKLVVVEPHERAFDIGNHTCYLKILNDEEYTIWVNWEEHYCKFQDLPLAAMVTIADNI